MDESNPRVSSTAVTSVDSLALSVATTPSTTTTSSIPITTTSSSPIATATPIKTNDKHGLPNGAVAGIAIGTFIAGILIACLLFFLLGRKARGRQTQISPDIYHGKSEESNSGVPIASSTSAAGVVESNLPQPKADTDIARDLSTIETKIGNHILSYYGGDVKITPNVQFTADDSDLPLNNQRLSTLMANPAHRPIALRMLIASILTSRMSVLSQPDESLLPPGTASTIHAMPQIAAGDGVRRAFFTKWSSITAFLLHGSSSQDPQLIANIQRATADLDKIIGPFASPQFAPQERLANLEALVQRSAQMASILFSQPTFWKFNWTSSEAPSNSQVSERLVVFPGLEKLTDMDGRPLSTPVTVEPAKVVEI